MFAYLIPMVVGIILIIIGIDNLRGNIDSVHFYHTHRVKQSDKKAYGKLMGIGTLICSLGTMSFGILALLSDTTDNPSLSTAGSYLAVMGLIADIGFMTYATVKYNKGIF